MLKQPQDGRHCLSSQILYRAFHTKPLKDLRDIYIIRKHPTDAVAAVTQIREPSVISRATMYRINPFMDVLGEVSETHFFSNKFSWGNGCILNKVVVEW